MTVGEVIREARAYRGITQIELSDRLGAERKNVAKISAHENGRQVMTLATLEQYANALEITIGYRPDRGWSWRPA